MPLRSKIRSGYLIAVVLLLVSYFFIFLSVWNVQKEYDWLTNSYRAETRIAELKNSIVEAETGVRGYYITKNEAFPNTLSETQNRISSLYNELQIFEAKNPDQLNLLDSIKQLIDLRISLMQKNIATFQSASNQITSEVETNRQKGQKILDSISLFTRHFISAEEKLMEERKNKLTGFFKSTRIIVSLSLLTSVLAILYSLFNYNRESVARDESTKKNIQYQKELERHIDELKKMDAEVKELKSMEKFTATGRVARTIAHEVRNPLTNISLAAEQLQEMAVQNNESSMLLDMINRNAIRINQLVSDLLNATKIIELNIKTADVNRILDETLALAADRIDLSKIKVERNYYPGECNVDVDDQKIKVAFLNIIVNGIEAMEKSKGILKLTTRKDGDKCIIEIEDNGSGMDEDTIQKLFDPYFTNKSNGNGLGLTNTQNIIMSHRGKVSVQSKQGKGSLFKITLKVTE